MFTYEEALDYIYSFTDYEKTTSYRYAPKFFDLARMERLLASLDNPHRRFPSVHIAGTKGKGSTAAMTASVLQAAGYRTGLYTSPHLHTFRERIQTEGRKITRKEVVELVEEVRPAIERIPGVTTFEAITAIGFLHFARTGVEIAVIEVGLGGRLDATNVVHPEVSIITSLSLDHTYLLGDTLAAIAFEKAGIIKPGVPVISAPQRAEAINVLKTISRERNAPLIEIGRDWDYQAGAANWDGQHFTLQKITDGHSTSNELSGEYWLPLLGRHQLENASSAIAALDVLRQSGFEIPTTAIHQGMYDVQWPGRLEIVSRDPLLVVDCAHNPYSSQALRRALAEWFPGEQWVLIFGASADKDIAGMLQELLPISTYTIVTRSDHPRSATPITLADTVASVGGGAEVTVNVKRALQRGLTMIEPGSGLLATGSIFLVADMREEWASHIGDSIPENDDNDD